MDSLLAELLARFGFFATGPGLLTTGALATLIILVWDWRFALIALAFVRLGIAVLVVQVHGVEMQWATVQLIVTVIGTLTLALSAQQVQPHLTVQKPGSFLLRLLTIVLFIASWRLFNLQLTLPVAAPQEAQLFLWLALCALLLLGLSDAPLMTGIAIMLWFAAMQAIVEILLPASHIFVLLGMLELILALACSYLTLTGRIPVETAFPIVTDATFSLDVPVPISTANSGLTSNGHTPGGGGGFAQPSLPTKRPLGVSPLRGGPA